MDKYDAMVQKINGELKTLRSEAVRHGDSDRFIRVIDALVQLTTMGDEQAAPIAAVQTVPAGDCLHEKITANGVCENCGEMLPSAAQCTHKDDQGNPLLNVFGKCTRCGVEVIA